MAAIKSVAIMAALLAAPVAGNMEELLSVVNTVEQRNSANAELISEIKTLSEAQPEPSAVRQELLSELREAREQMQPKPSAVRQDLIAELRSAREQEQPKPSALRQELLAELRTAREQEQPKPSAVRQELLAELQNAREQMQPKPPSETRQALLAELRAAREQEEAAAPSPSPVRNEVLAELQAAREKALVEQFLDELERDEEPTPARVYTEAELLELPWDDSEELLERKAEPVEESASAAEKMEAFNRLLRTLVVSGVALGLAAAAKLPELDLKRAARAPGQWVTLALFFVPLLVVTADYAFDIALGNEFGLIASCWGLAAMAAVHLRGKQEKVKVAM